MKHRNKLFMLLMIFFCYGLFAAINVAAEEPAVWDGASAVEGIDYTVSENEVTINTELGLAYVAYMTNQDSNWSQDKLFILTNDLDLQGKEWTPIGADDFFKGTFDFGGKKISGITITSNYTHSGLFGKNAGVILSPNISVTKIISSNIGVSYAGGLCALNIGTIGSIEGEAVIRALIEGDIAVSTTGVAFAGGLVGQNTENGLIGTSGQGAVKIDIVVNGTISAYSSSSNALSGGLAGENNAFIGSSSQSSGGDVEINVIIDDDGKIFARTNMAVATGYARSGGVVGNIVTGKILGISGEQNLANLSILVSNNAISEDKGILAARNENGATSSAAGGIAGVVNKDSVMGSNGQGIVFLAVKTSKKTINMNYGTWIGSIAGYQIGSVGAKTVAKTYILTLGDSLEISQGAGTFTTGSKAVITEKYRLQGKIQIEKVLFDVPQLAFKIIPYTNFIPDRWYKDGKEHDIQITQENGEYSSSFMPAVGSSYECLFLYENSDEKTAMRYNIQNYIEFTQNLLTVDDFIKADFWKKLINTSILSQEEDYVEILISIKQADDKMEIFAEENLFDQAESYLSLISSAQPQNYEEIVLLLNYRKNVTIEAARYSDVIKDKLTLADGTIMGFMLNMLEGFVDEIVRLEDFIYYEMLIKKFGLLSEEYLLNQQMQERVDRVIRYYRENILNGFSSQGMDYVRQTEVGIEFSGYGIYPYRVNYNKGEDITSLEIVFYLNELAFYSTSTTSNAIMVSVLNVPGYYKNMKYSDDGVIKVVEGFNFWLRVAEMGTEVKIFKPKYDKKNLNENTSVTDEQIASFECLTPGDYMRYRILIEQTKNGWTVTVNNKSFSLSFNQLSKDIFDDNMAYVSIGSALNERSYKNTITIHKIGDSVFGDETSYLSPERVLPPLIDPPPIIEDGIDLKGCKAKGYLPIELFLMAILSLFVAYRRRQQ